MNVFRAMLIKDVTRELRSREVFISGFLFSIILLCVVYFAVASGGMDHREMTAGALWLCILFSGTIGLNRTHQSEVANGCYRALIMMPGEGGWFYLAKVCANLLLLGIMLMLLLPLVALFFATSLLPVLGPLLASLGLGMLAFVAIGTLVVVITANTRMKDVLFPVVQLPLVVPVMIAGVNSSVAAINGEPAWVWLRFLLAVNLVFLSAGFLLYEFLLEE